MTSPIENVAAERVAVLGLGYVGCVTAACLAGLGHSVMGVDRDEYKVEQVRQGLAPFYEPGLEELVREGRASGRLDASVDLAQAIESCDIALICVGTPSGPDGELDLRQLIRVSDQIGGALAARPRPFIVAVRSTVLPHTCETVVQPRVRGAAVVSNPEFLREGSAVQDFRNPPLLVVGGEERAAVERVAALYGPLQTAPRLVDLRTAEMIKYACNAFHAVKIAFANEIGALAESLAVSGREVMETLCGDRALNISPAYLMPGFAFGGSCLPKDLRALVCRARAARLPLPLLEAVLPSNAGQIERAVQAVLALPAGRLGVYGLAFKENTDDLRESPVVAVLARLLAAGRELRVWDPHVRLESIYGSNRQFLLEALPGIGGLVAGDLDGLLGWAGQLALMRRPSAGDAAAIRASGLPVLDLAGAGPSV